MAIKSRKKIPNDLVIELTSNLNGGMTFADKKNKTNTYISFRGIDDTDDCSYADIKALQKQSPKMLEKAYMVITDVSSFEDPDFKVNDLIFNLNLDELYNGAINPRDIGKFLTSTKYKTFVNKLNQGDDNLIDVILERAVYMYKQGRFNDATKMNYLQSLFPSMKMFK
ncbi:MAG: hypothetical protein PHO58_05990 [Bacilli bacterium]|nr:hypothetical protein [Bacilli bacterium]